jgi:hypothetical protein
VHEWLEQAVGRLAAGAGDDASVYALSDHEQRALLELARVAAHESGERTNAPLLCYLVGRLQGGRGLDELAEAIRRSSS